MSLHRTSSTFVFIHLVLQHESKADSSSESFPFADIILCWLFGIVNVPLIGLSMGVGMFDWAASTSVAALTDEQISQLCALQNASSLIVVDPTVVVPAELGFLHRRPEAYLVWSIGLFFVTIINLCAVVGIAVMRYLSKSVYNQIITFFVGLGVGSLSGSSFYHLLPQAHPSLVDAKDADGNPSHEYLDMAHFSLIGVYTFFLADKLIKVILQGRKRVEPHEWKENGRISSELSGRSDRPLLNGSHKGTDTPMEIEMAEINHGKSMGNQAHGICSHEHELEFSAGDSAIAAVAWMIVFGDGLHNLIDGVSIGASFAESIHSGLSVSLAVLAEEFPHELGDVAILVASGLSLRQALLYNLLSAMTCYIGFGVGVAIGDFGPHTTKYLFALAGGMFLYISLSCMMPEMKKAMEEALAVSLPRGIYVFLLQASGLFTGLTLMYLMARYGGEISL